MHDERSRCYDHRFLCSILQAVAQPPQSNGSPDLIDAESMSSPGSSALFARIDPTRSRRCTSSRWLGSTLWGIALGLTTAASAIEPASDGTGPLEPRHREFLEWTEPLRSEVETEVFLKLDEDYRRDSFIDRFWRRRDPFPDTPRNELRERWLENARALAPELEEAGGDERLLLLLHGKPRRTFRDGCQLLAPLEIWYYSSSPIVAAEFYAVLHGRGDAPRLWHPSNGLAPLLFSSVGLNTDEILATIQQQCSRGDEIVTALTLSLDWDRVHEHAAPRPPDEWALAFLEASAQSDGAQTIETRHQAVGRRQSRTVMQTTLLLPRAEVTPDEDGTINLVVDGEVVRDDELFDSFRYRFELPADLGASGAGAPDQLPILFERYLRPGTYRLVLEVHENGGDGLWSHDEELTVPRPSATQRTDAIFAGNTTTPTGYDGEAETQADRTDLQTTLRLSVPSRELLIGAFRVEARVDGEVDRIAFELDGEHKLTKSRPPYSVELDAGRVPRPHELIARAYDAEGNEVARDRVTLNAGPQRFGVRLIEPRRGESYEGFVRATAAVQVPPLEDLEVVEFYLNERRLASLYQAPWTVRVPVPADEELAFVRVVAKLRDGHQTEDLVFLNSPVDVEYLDVDMVEVYTTVVNRRGLPIDGLSREEFTLEEDGVPQRIQEFRLVRDLPVHACILFDTSTSMMERLEEAESAAMHFFDRVLDERDRACLVTFNDVHEVVVDFTDRKDVLAGGLRDLEAEGETALYDSLIHTLYLFNGLRGRQALILLSDGADSRSDFRFQEVLEFARRSEVTIYVIGVDIDNRDMMVRAQMAQLARDTGGRTFFIDAVSELRRVYELIETELRSQYLLAYQSTSSRDRNEFREIEVDLTRRGLRARALRGYYP